MSPKPQLENSREASAADVQAGGVIVMPWLDGMEIGGGYDSVTQTVKGNAKDPKLTLKLTPGTGMSARDVQITATKITSNEEFRNHLSTFASVSGSYGVFSASASSKFVRDTKVNIYGLNFAITAAVTNREQHLAEYAIDPDELESLDSDAFRRKYGDYFVQGQITGGQLMALISLDVTSSDTKDQLNVKAKADYEGASLEIGGRFQLEISEAAKQKGVSLRISFSDIGGFGATADFKSVESIMAAAKSFPKVVQDKGGAPLYAVLKPYALLKAAPGQASFATAAAKDILNMLERVYLRAKNILDSVNFALENPSSVSADPAQLRLIQQEMTSLIQDVISKHNSVSADPKKLIEVPQLPELDKIPVQLSSTGLLRIGPPEPSASPELVLQVLNEALSNVSTTSKKRAYLEFLERAASDVQEQCTSAMDIIQTLMDVIKSIDTELATSRTQVLNDLIDHVDAAAAVRRRQVLQEKQDFAVLATSPGEFSSITRVLWDDSKDAVQYGLMPFWTYLSTSDPATGQRSGLLLDLLKVTTQIGSGKRVLDVIRFPQATWAAQLDSFRRGIRKLPDLTSTLAFEKKKLT